jgi:hypothetical protein
VKEIIFGRTGVAVGKDGREVAWAEVVGVAVSIGAAVVVAVGVSLAVAVSVGVGVSAVADGVTVARTILSALCCVAVTSTFASCWPVVNLVSTPKSNSPQPTILKAAKRDTMLYKTGNRLI